MFGDNLSSPPQTPTTIAASFHLAPCEPAYTTATYKPPSLYPNKKQRTGLFQERVPSVQIGSNFSSPGLASAAFDSRRPDQSHPSGLASAAEVHDSRRFSVQFPSHSSRPAIPPTGTDGARLASEHAYYSTPVQTPTSAMPDRSHHASSLRRDPSSSCALEPQQYAYSDHASMHLASRRSSIDSYAGRSSAPIDSNHPRHSSFEPGHRIPFASRYEMELAPDKIQRLEYPQTHAFPAFSQGSYEPAQPSFFAPSAYEYQHGKARKRSNLPKQSTEIMKIWFDQVRCIEFSAHKRGCTTDLAIRTLPILTQAKSRKRCFRMWVIHLVAPPCCTPLTVSCRPRA